MPPNKRDYWLRVRVEVVAYFHLDLKSKYTQQCCFDDPTNMGRESLLRNILYFIEIKASLLNVSELSLAKEIYNLFCRDQMSEEGKAQDLQLIETINNMAIVLACSLHCFVEPIE